MNSKYVGYIFAILMIVAAILGFDRYDPNRIIISILFILMATNELARDLRSERAMKLKSFSRIVIISLSVILIFRAIFIKVT